MRVLEAARAIGVSADMIRRLDRTGKIRLSQDLNGHRRIADGEIAELRRLIFPTAPQRPPVLGPASGS